MFNRHAHEWGENSKGCFCLRCGEWMGKKEDDNHSTDFFAAWSPKPDVMWPTGESKKDDYLDNDY